MIQSGTREHEVCDYAENQKAAFDRTVRSTFIQTAEVIRVIFPGT